MLPKMAPDYTQQESLVPTLLRAKPIVVAGCGTIGSWVTLSLCKMGFRRVTVVDFDRTAPHNLPAQMLHSGVSYKAYGVRLLCRYLGAAPLKAYMSRFERFAEEHPRKLKGATLFLCVDTVEARQAAASMAQACGVEQMIDFRMGPEAGSVLMVGPMSFSAYEKSLEGEFMAEGCGARALLPNALAMVGLTLTHWLARQRGAGRAISRFSVDTKGLIIEEETE